MKKLLLTFFTSLLLLTNTTNIPLNTETQSHDDPDFPIVHTHKFHP